MRTTTANIWEPTTQDQMALSRWDNEGGADKSGSQHASLTIGLPVSRTLSLDTFYGPIDFRCRQGSSAAGATP